MKFINIKAEILDPTGVAVEVKQMNLEHRVDSHPARILLTIGEAVWMTTDRGLTMRRVVPKEE